MAKLLTDTVMSVIVHKFCQPYLTPVYSLAAFVAAWCAVLCCIFSVLHSTLCYLLSRTSWRVVTDRILQYLMLTRLSAPRLGSVGAVYTFRRMRKSSSRHLLRQESGSYTQAQMFSVQLFRRGRLFGIFTILVQYYFICYAIGIVLRCNWSLVQRIQASGTKRRPCSTRLVTYDLG